MSMVKGAANVILGSDIQSVISSFGCTQKEWELVTGKRVWVGTERNIVSRTLDSLLHGFVDSLGIPRFELPSEYVATIIALFVSPCNFFGACNYLGSHISGHDLMSQANLVETTDGLERVSPSKLFAHVCEIYSGDVLNESVVNFESKSNFAIAYELEKLGGKIKKGGKK